ncbi:MAG: Omp28 family outer membrane lipoprotein [Muribaculaceae bacterium]|nr:Omp28 family outer membrane lipoprotein [Muribaculaceae bacterium]
MKKLYYIFLMWAALGLMVACDEVSVDKRLTYVEPPQVSRAVLIEDYTGQYCVNCPRATEEIERLIEQYGDSIVIAVAIHSGPFGKSKGEPSPLYTEVGDMYFNTWGMSAQPIGLIDRLFGSTPFSYTDWAGGVNYEVAIEPPVSFLTDIDYDAETRDASIEVQTIGLDSALVSGKLQVWLVEDSIDSFQLMPDGSREEHYNHMHVFRASVNDPWGDALSVSHGQVAVKNYELKLDPAWVPEHCSVVTFLYDDSGVHQVAKKKLID